ncbi:MAG: sigma 54-interacting transcriptional regulator [Polyangiaceae bacterium]
MNETAPLSPEAKSQRAAARHHVLVIHQHASIEQLPLQPGRPVVIGREPPADIVVCDRSVSRRHARIALVEGRVLVEDLGSRNGTYVEQERVERAAVAIGTEIVLGDVVASVQLSRAIDRSPAGFDRHDAFVTLAEHEMRRARFFGAGGAVVFLRFERGQEAALRQLCGKIAGKLRPVDRVAIYSSEGIEILLPDASVAQAVALGERLRELNGGAMTLAVGVAGLAGTQGFAEDVIAAARSVAREGSPVGVFTEQATTTWSPEGVAGRSLLHVPGLAPVLELGRRVARAAIAVLIVGETGTGKELVARYLHENSPRATSPMVAVNCAAIPRELLESTLFGHEKGAFTGATQARRGVFEAADKGTVFLDEVGELSAGAQAALLRVLESKTVVRVGSTGEVPVAVRIVAATHRDLDAMAEQGQFRSDLLFRLNSVVIEIPPLRERRSDIRPLAEHFLREANRENGRSLAGIEGSALELLTSYAWPGNVRELRNAIERAVVVAMGERIAPEDLPERVRRARLAGGSGSVHPSAHPEAGRAGEGGGVSAGVSASVGVGGGASAGGGTGVSASVGVGGGASAEEARGARRRARRRGTAMGHLATRPTCCAGR